MGPQQELWIPQAARDAMTFTKADAPKTGPSFGAWSGRDLSYLGLPGGNVMAFDLSRLTLHDYREMRSHYQINASLMILMFMIFQQDYEIQSDDPRIAKRVDDIFRRSWPKLARGMSQAHWAGFSPMALEFDNDGPSKSVIISKFKDLVPEECRVNWREVDGMSNNGGVPTKMYEYDGIAQWATGTYFGVDGSGSGRFGGGSTVVPPEYSVWYPLLMENGDYYGRKLLKPAFQSWFFSILMHLFTNRYFERFAEPTPIGRADFDEVLTDSSGNPVSGKQAMTNVLTNLRNRGVVVLPSSRHQVGDSGKSEYDFDIEFLESQMRGADFERYLMRLDEEMSVGLLTPLGAMRTGDTGSHNSIQVQIELYLWNLNAMTGDMKSYIDDFVLSRLVDFNFGKNAARAYWVPKKFGKDNAETLRAVAMESLRVGDVKADAHELGEAIGLKLEDISELVRPNNALGEDPNNPVASPAAVNPTGGPPVDPRISRGTHQDRTTPKTGDSGVLRSRMAARISTQVTKAKRQHATDFAPDFGFQRSMEDLFGDADAATQVYEHLDEWARDAYPVVDTADEFVKLFEKRLALELS